MSPTFSNFCEIFCSAEWFQQQQEFTNEIENMEVNELKKCLAKFYVSVRKTDGSYYKKTGLLSIRAAPRPTSYSLAKQQEIFLILLSRIIINVITLKQLVA